MKKRLSGLFMMLSATTLVLAACGGTDAEESSSAGSDTGSSGESDVRTVEHAMGTAEIEGTPERVVTLFQGATDTITEFGVSPVGAVDSWAEAPMYEYLADDLGDVTYLGDETQPNLEEIAALEPDLIIATQVRHEEIYEQLSQIAPTVVTGLLYDFKETTTVLGDSLGQEEKAEELLGEWDARVADFGEKAGELENWPMSAAVLNYRQDHARIYVTGFAGSILQDLGFEEPRDLEGEDHEIVMLNDKEAIPQMNADVIYQFMEDDPAVKQNYEEWTSHPLYQELDAVKSDDVNTVNEIEWNLGGGYNAANLMLDDVYEYLGLEK